MHGEECLDRGHASVKQKQVFSNWLGPFRAI
jgi:hypothetical protein